MDAVIDIDGLCAPLSDDSPCGDDPRDDERFDSPYQQLKTLREEAMAGERVNRSAMDDSEGSDSYAQATAWQAVVDQATAIIAENAKDLEVAALLMEGLVRASGVAGLRDGMLLTTRLVKDYWDNLNPPLDPNDEDSLEDRIAAFNGLDGASQPGTVARYIPRLPITGQGYDDFLSYELAAAQAGDDSGDSSSGSIEEAARNTSMDFYVDLVADIESCQEALKEMDDAFTEVCGYDGPSVGRIREALENYLGNVRHVGKDQLELAAAKALEAEAIDEVEGAEGEAVAGGAAAAPGGGAGPIQNRSDALKRLRVVTDYFRRTEPHSPLSYSMENLLRWADMPLDKLIEEWIPDSTAREHFQLMTGLRGGGSEEGEEW